MPEAIATGLCEEKKDERKNWGSVRSVGVNYVPDAFRSSANCEIRGMEMEYPIRVGYY